MNPKSEYWVLDGASSTYELRIEIKAWGGWWESTHKNWCISTNKEDKAYKILTNCGLKLQWRR